MNPILFILTLGISFVVVRAGAVAFQLTGLGWKLAKFQALSCFSGTGFTTREAELIVGHPRRRRIASLLMILGNAGLVALVATFANSIQPQFLGINSRIGWLWAGLGPIINLVLITAVGYGLYRYVTRSDIARKLTDYLHARFRTSGIVAPVSFEELLFTRGGFGVIRVEITPDSSLVDMTLKKSGLLTREHITVLAVYRQREVFQTPDDALRLRIGDELLCFGEMDHMKRVFHTQYSDTEAVSGETQDRAEDESPHAAASDHPDAS